MGRLGREGNCYDVLRLIVYDGVRLETATDEGFTFAIFHAELDVGKVAEWTFLYDFEPDLDSGFTIRS